MTGASSIYLDFDNIYGCIGDKSLSPKDKRSALFSLVAGMSYWVKDMEKNNNLNILRRRVFYNESIFHRYSDHFIRAGFICRGCPTYTFNYKSSVDGHIYITAMEDFYEKPFIDTFIFMTSDTDFITLMFKLVEENKRVKLLTFNQRMIRQLSGTKIELLSANAFIDSLIDKIRNEIENPYPMEIINFAIQKQNNGYNKGHYVIEDFSNDTATNNTPVVNQPLISPTINREIPKVTEEIMEQPIIQPIKKMDISKYEYLYNIKSSVLVIRKAIDISLNFKSSAQCIAVGLQHGLAIRIRRPLKRGGEGYHAYIYGNFGNEYVSSDIVKRYLNEEMSIDDLSVISSIRKKIREHDKVEDDKGLYFDFEIQKFFEMMDKSKQLSNVG